MTADPTFYDYLLGPDGVLPKWLRRKWGQRFFAPVGVVTEGFRKAAMYAVLARFPSKAPIDALPVIGEDRKLEQLPGESSASYRVRLRGAFPAYQQAGNHSTGLQNRLREAGFATATVYEANDFAPSPGQSWARFWVVIFDPTLVTTTFKWGDGTKWGAKAWGGVNATTIAQIRKLIRKWKAPYAHLDKVTVVTSGKPWGCFAWGDGTKWGGSSSQFSL